MRWWPRAGAWALVALLFSSVFTIFNLLMAVLMPLSDFGLFSYGQSLVLLVGVIIATLVLEPTTTVGTRYGDDEQLRYLSFALIASLIVGLVAALPLAAMFWLVQRDNSFALLVVAVVVFAACAILPCRPALSLYARALQLPDRARCIARGLAARGAADPVAHRHGVAGPPRSPQPVLRAPSRPHGW